MPVPTEKGVELMAQWQAIALNTKPKRKPSEYMDLRFVNEAMAELAQKYMERRSGRSNMSRRHAQGL